MDISTSNSPADIVTIDDTSRDNTVSVNNFDFHVQTGDYFAMIATLLGFVEEATKKLQEKDEMMKIAGSQIVELKKNLMYLQENYTMEPKEKKPNT